VRQCERKQLCRHQDQWRRSGGRRCSKCRSREPSLAARDEDHSEVGCPPAVHGGPWWSRSPPAAHGRDPTPERWMPEGGGDPMGRLCWSRPLPRPADP